MVECEGMISTKRLLKMVEKGESQNLEFKLNLESTKKLQSDFLCLKKKIFINKRIFLYPEWQISN